jgi:hypothetical protein
MMHSINVSFIIVCITVALITAIAIVIISGVITTVISTLTNHAHFQHARYG